MKEMKKAKRLLSVLMAVSLAGAAFALSVSATEFTRKFNGVAGIDGKKAGTSSYKNNIVTIDLPDAGSLCWSYVPSATDLSFQFRVDVDKDPEFDWLGINITNDGYALLGEGTGLSTIFFRTGDGYCSRVVEADVMEWDAAVAKQINEGSLYDDNNKAPQEGYAFGYGEWITFSMKKNGSKWDLKINGVDMVKTRYKGFDEDMTRLLGNGKITLSIFTSGVPGTVELKSYTVPSTPVTNTSSAASPNSSSAVKPPVSSTASATSSTVSMTSTVNSTDSSVTTVESAPSSEAAVSSENVQSEGNTNSEQQVLTSGAADDEGGNGLVIGIIIAVVVILAAGGITTFLILKKKKQ